jgi:hypothetical protein
MIVTSLVLGGVAAFTLATTSTWTSAESTRTSVLTASQATHRLAQVLGRARFVLYSRVGTTANPAAIILWDHDGDVATGVAADGKVQFSELVMFKYNPAAKTLDLYSPPSVIAVDPDWSYALLSTSAAVTSFAASGATSAPVARNVSGATFATSGTSNKVVTYSLTFDRTETEQVETGAVTLRFIGATPP